MPFTVDQVTDHTAGDISALLRPTVLTDDATLVSQVFNILRDLIVTLQLLPGQQLSENEIAEALAASKTPVREALIRLEDAGLVNIVPKSGTYVTPIRMDRYADACFVRLHLEIAVVRRAAQTRQPEDITELRRQLIVQATAIAADQPLFELDETMHRTFCHVAQVPGVWETLKFSQADVDRVRHLKRLHNIARKSQVVEQHRAIVDAIESGCVDTAEATMLAHIGGLADEVSQMAKLYPGLLDYIQRLNEIRVGPRARAAKGRHEATSGRDHVESISG